MSVDIPEDIALLVNCPEKINEVIILHLKICI